MEGVKFAGVFIFVLVIATNVNNAIAHGAAIIGTDNKMEEETMHELKKIEACASRCKPEEDKCRMECIKKSLGGMHKFKLDEAKFEMISVYRSIFCIAGCGSTMSELCDKKGQYLFISFIKHD